MLEIHEKVRCEVPDNGSPNANFGAEEGRDFYFFAFFFFFPFCDS